MARRSSRLSADDATRGSHRAVPDLDEPIPQHGGLWSLPGGHDRADEGPKAEGFEAAVRPVEERRSSPDRLRESDLERIELTLDGAG